MLSPFYLEPFSFVSISSISKIEKYIDFVNDPINNFVWGWPTVFLIASTGIILMFGLKFKPILKIPYAFNLLLKDVNTSAKIGTITTFEALMTSLSATIGTGNIAGVATAIALGGPGSIFWMWIISLFGMATKFAEAVLAIKYREVDALGNYVGGPMYYIKNGLGAKWRWLGTLFAIFGVFAGFGIGNGVQAFEVSNALEQLGVPRILTGFILATLVFSVIIGGVKRIARAASTIVPAMAAIYIISSLVILLINYSQIPSAISTIFGNAFTGKAALTGTLVQVILLGFQRGIFSNEAGLGSAPIAHASANTNDPVKQGLVAMLGTFIDTIIICTMTALVIITTGAYQTGESGSNLSILAFNTGLPGSGLVVTFGLVFFAFTTLLGWSLYGERCIEFLFGIKAIVPFRYIWVGVVVIGAIVQNRGVIWSIADTLNGLMAIPNLIALLLLSGTVFKLVNEYKFNKISS